MAAGITLFTIYWESRELGSVTMGKGIFTAFRLMAKVPGKDYVVSVYPGIVWYVLLFGVGNVLAGEAARFLIGKV